MPNLRIKATEYAEQQLEALGLSRALELELKDGSVIEVLNPLLWGDTTEAAVKKANEDGPKPYNYRYARAVLGAKDHDRFLKAGGESSHIALAVACLKRGDVVGQDGADPKDAPSKGS